VGFSLRSEDGEVCGFNDWLLQLLPDYGCVKVALIQPEKRRRIKTDRRDAKELSELLWINRDRIAKGLPVRGVRQVVMPTLIDTENQRLTSLRNAAVAIGFAGLVLARH
jgi:transposase